MLILHVSSGVGGRRPATAVLSLAGCIGPAARCPASSGSGTSRIQNRLTGRLAPRSTGPSAAGPSAAGPDAAGPASPAAPGGDAAPAAASTSAAAPNSAGAPAPTNGAGAGAPAPVPSPSPSPAGPEAEGAGPSPSPSPSSPAAATDATAATAAGVDLESLSEPRKYVLADEWGFSRLGCGLPAGAPPTTFGQILPERLFGYSLRSAVAAVALPLSVMAVGYGWLWFWRGVCPLWQQALCAVLIGTAYTGLFKVAHECARFAFVPQSPGLNDALGSLLMLPSLYPFPSWRLAYMSHVLSLNVLWRDTWAWHPLTKVEMATHLLSGRKGALAWARLALTTPLKLLGSIGHWAGRAWDGLDLRRFHPGSYGEILSGWAAPLLFAGLAFPAMIAAGGVSGFLTCYVAPWLVFHFWLSLLSLAAHTAPHVAFRTEDDPRYDAGAAAVSGTVTMRLPAPLEALINYANYQLPQIVAPGLPLWHAREAYDIMATKLAPYTSEAKLTMRYLTNQITRWQVYDEESHTYRPYDEVLDELRTDFATLAREREAAEAALAAATEAAGAEEGQGQSQGENGGAAPGLALA
ncbi:hypothetical protein HYH03_004595 [Edaphochlamys debaryana]|uniref:Uncharacterized protein n=1 Tax=Edaphochlamys debaryana TaxID=47281 RepID=A0A836C238_9CHLO|nr:hypothetical protein HYH03_004595 [Edaphochlamys debaryana]|eukprot:KAG2497440.1 hypothetical protein HYH03_004595 [Edaphochlamys debaryana]